MTEPPRVEAPTPLSILEIFIKRWPVALAPLVAFGLVVGTSALAQLGKGNANVWDTLGGNILQPKSPPRIIAATVMISPLVLKIQGNHQVGWDVRQNFSGHVQKFLALASAEIPATTLENATESKDFDEKNHEISFAFTSSSHSGHRGAGGSKVSGVSGAHASGSKSSSPLHMTQDPEKPYWVHCWTIANDTSSPSSSSSDSSSASPEGSESQLADVEASTEKMVSLYHGLHPGPVPASLTQAQKSSHLMDQQLQEMEEKLQTLQLQAKGGKHLYTQEALHLQSSLYLQSMLSVSKSMQGSLHQRYQGLSKELGLGGIRGGKRNKNLSLGQIHALWVQNQTVATLQRQLAQTVVAHEKTKLAMAKSSQENASATPSDGGSPPAKAQDVDTLALQESMIAKLHQEIQVAEAQANDLKKPPVASSMTYVSHQPGPHSSGDPQKDLNLHPAVDTHSVSSQSGVGSSVDELARLIEKVPTLQQENAMLASLMETDVKLKANARKLRNIQHAFTHETQTVKKLSALLEGLDELENLHTELEKKYEQLADFSGQYNLLQPIFQENQLTIVSRPRLLDAKTAERFLSKIRKTQHSANSDASNGLPDPFTLVGMVMVSLALGFAAALYQEYTGGMVSSYPQKEKHPSSSPDIHPLGPESETPPSPLKDTKPRSVPLQKGQPRQAKNLAPAIASDKKVSDIQAAPPGAYAVELDISSLKSPAQLWAQCQNPDAPLAHSFSQLLSDLKGFLATDSAPFPAKIGFSGNTMMASGLAMALAQSVGKMGKKVALVELSPETTLLPYLFHLDVEFGAYDMVSQPKHLASILTQLQHDAPSAHLTIIPRGTRPLDFNKQSKAIAHWVLDLRQRFDYLIFAMPDWTTHGAACSLPTPWKKWLGGQHATQKAHLKLLGAMGLKALLWAEGSEDVQSKTKQADLSKKQQFKKEQFKTFQKVLPHMVLVRVQEV